MRSTYTRTVCRGAWSLGTACGKCARCEETRPITATVQSPSPIHAATLSTLRQQIARIPAGPGRSADEYVEDLRRTLDCMEVAETLDAPAERKFARFGNHADPLIDYHVEVHAIRGLVTDYVKSGEGNKDTIGARIEKAWLDVVQPEWVELKNFLRKIDAEFRQHDCMEVAETIDADREPLQLREGSFYRRRDGITRGPVKRCAIGDEQPWEIDDEHGFNCYDHDGHWWPDATEPHVHDLIAEAPAPVVDTICTPTVPVTVDRNTQIVDPDTGCLTELGAALLNGKDAQIAELRRLVEGRL